MKLRSIPGWNALEYAALRGAIAILSLLPIVWATEIARFFGTCAYYLGSSRRKTTLQNLDNAYGDTLSLEAKNKIALESLQHLLIAGMEFFRMPSMLAEAKPRFEFQNLEYLDQAFKKGKGVILVISHLGSWEYLAFLPYLGGYPCSVVVREIKNAYVDKWSREMRRKTQLNPIDRRNSIRPILSELKKNHLVAILIDQWAGPDGLWMNFFNKPTSTTSIPARLAQRTEAAMIPAYCIRKSPGQYQIVMFSEVPVAAGEDWEKETTQTLNRWLENQISKFPNQWIWSHKRWKEFSRYRSQPQ